MRLILILLVLPTIIGGAPLTTTGARDSADLVLEWAAPPFRLTPVGGDDGQTYIRVETQAQGFSNGGPPGWPSLPRLGSLIALPPSGDFGLELIDVLYETVPLDHPVALAPGLAPPQFDASGHLLRGDRIVARDDAAYARTAPFPGEPVTLGDAVWMRNHRLARITFTPFHYHPLQRTLKVVRHVRVRVWWELSTTSPTASAADDPLDDGLSQLVLNPADLPAFSAHDMTGALFNAHGRRSDAYASANRLNIAEQLAASGLYKVQVTTEGIYALDYATLAAAGLPLESLDPARLRLVNDGIEVAAQWEGDGDAAFEPGERLLFYARPQLTRYAGYDVFWLAWDSAIGQRMATRSGTPTGLPIGTAWATAQVEENHEYDSLYSGRDGDHWFWRRLKLPDLISDTFEIRLETPDPAMTGELRVWLRAFTAAEQDPDHRVRFSVNGSHIGDAQWEGDVIYTATLDLPAGLLQAQGNAIDLRLPGDTGAKIEGTWVDAMALTYGLKAVSGDVARFRGQSQARAYSIEGFSTQTPRVYDVTDPNAPRVVTGFAINADRVSVGDVGPTPAEYLVLTEDRILLPHAVHAAKSLDDPPNGADYLIITHPDFEAALAPLVSHRMNQGLRVTTVDVEAIYDGFGDGRMDPVAIRSFLAHAYANWAAPALRYVLLVGDGTYDPRGYLPDTNPTYLPPYLADVDPELGETASDNQYADLTGDVLPELRLGRFPVNTPAEVEAVVNKIIGYEATPLPGDWNRRLVFGADNPSAAGDHHAYANSEFNTYATPDYGYEGSRVYLSISAGAPHLYTDAQEAQQALITELNQGALLYTYFGHASWHQEAVLETDDYAPLFHRDHIAQLSNHRRWPVVLHMTCLTGLYTHRTSNTLDESLLRAEDVGAVAVWGASGNGVATGHHILNRAFYQGAFDNGQTELGAITHSALASLYAVGIFDDLIETYHLFGDPALGLNNTKTDLPFSAFLPIMGRDF